MKENKDTILVVDDSAIVRATVKSVLGEKYRILEAENGEAALITIFSNQNETDKNNIDGIILDLNMPKMNGMKFLDKSPQEIPVLVVTGAETQIQVDVINEYSNVVDSIQKPFVAEQLKTKVAAMVARSKQITEGRVR